MGRDRKNSKCVPPYLSWFGGLAPSHEISTLTFSFVIIKYHNLTCITTRNYQNKGTMTTETDLSDQIAERLGFFFSDANLRMDRFLRRLVMDTYTGGFVEIDTLLKFNTIKKLSTDAAIIAEAVSKVEHPKLQLNEAKTSISRVDHFTEDMLKDNVRVSLRVSDLPIIENGDGSVYANTREEVEKIFSEFGKVALVRLLTNFDKEERKSVALGKGFVEFACVESLEKAAAALCVPTGDADAKPKSVLKLGENELRVKTMQQWLSKKAGEREAKHDAKAGEKRAREEGTDSKRKAEDEVVEFKLDWKKGCVVSLEGLPEGCDREMILEVVKKFVGEDVEARADYSRGEKDGKIRFNEPNDKIAELASKLNDGSANIGVSKVEKASVLEGEAEEKYYVDYIAFRTKQMREKGQEKRQRKTYAKKGQRRSR